MRDVEPGAVFVLSHVACPTGRTHQFRDAARWVLPRCRQREDVNGQQFEHLHAGRAGDRPCHEFKPGNAGFEARNCGRDPTIELGAAVDHFVWFEEWRSWDGIEKHGDTEHGSIFHKAMDRHIEEEWTFYSLAEGCPHAQQLPDAATFFRDPASGGARSVLHLLHMRARDEARREELLLDFGASLGQLGAEYAVLLENRSKRGELVLIAEGGAPELAQRLTELTERMHALCSEVGGLLTFGGPLWPEDVDVEIGESRSDLESFVETFVNDESDCFDLERCVKVLSFMLTRALPAPSSAVGLRPAHTVTRDREAHRCRNLSSTLAFALEPRAPLEHDERVLSRAHGRPGHVQRLLWFTHCLYRA